MWNSSDYLIDCCIWVNNIVTTPCAAYDCNNTLYVKPLFIVKIGY